MDQSPIVYQRLGRRTLATFLVRKLWVLVVVLLLLGGLIALLRIVPAGSATTVTLLLVTGGFLGLMAIGGTIGTAWLEYTHYGIALGETDFKFRHGIVIEEETGIPYRRIKEIKIKRNAADMMLGVSTLIVIVAGQEEDSRQSSVQVDALQKEFAAQVGAEILKRASLNTIN